MKNVDAKVIFDNGGGVILQLGDGFGHHYDDMKQAAKDYNDYLQDGTTKGWDGHEDEAAEIDPEYEEIRNGGYRVFNHHQVMDEVKNEDSSSWGNIDDFCVALAEILK